MLRLSEKSNLNKNNFDKIKVFNLLQVFLYVSIKSTLTGGGQKVAKKWPKILVTAVGSWKGPKAPFKNSQAKKNYIYSFFKENPVFGHFWSFLVKKKNYFFWSKMFATKSTAEN